MNTNGFGAGLLRSAAEKALRDIRQEPKRGLSNLLNLAKMFVPGRAALFEQARQELDKENSALAFLIGKLARKTAEETLLNFGLNLVCNCLDKGSRKIRTLQDEYGLSLPWFLTWILDDPDNPKPARLAQLLAQGRDLGIYCHVLRPGAAYPDLEHLALLPEKFPDCCFIFLVSPARLSSSFLTRLRGRAVLLALDLDSDTASLDQAAEAVFAGQFLAAGQLAYHAGQSHDLRVLEQLCRQQDLDLLLLVEDCQSKDWAKKSALAEQVQAARANIKQPPLIFDLWQDLADLGRLLNPEARLAVVSGKLELRLIDAAGACFCFDLRQSTLASVLLGRES